MNIWYKPKYVIETIPRTKDSVYSLLEHDIRALFQLELIEIVSPNLNGEFNITEIFSKWLDCYPDTAKNILLKNNISIDSFDILIPVDKKYSIMWPVESEEYFLSKGWPGKNILTYDEFMIKSLLE